MDSLQLICRDTSLAYDDDETNVIIICAIVRIASLFVGSEESVAIIRTICLPQEPNPEPRNQA